MDLKGCLEENKRKFKGYEIYLLRNFPRTGIGFFTLGGHYFYPDFIMWVKIKDHQHIVFLEPHGMEHGKTLDNEKIQLWKQMKELEREEALRDRNISLDSFILSKGSYQSLRDGRETPPSKEKFKDNHVLFLEDKHDWPGELFDKAGIGTSGVNRWK